MFVDIWMHGFDSCLCIKVIKCVDIFWWLIHLASVEGLEVGNFLRYAIITMLPLLEQKHPERLSSSTFLMRLMFVSLLKMRLTGMKWNILEYISHHHSPHTKLNITYSRHMLYQSNQNNNYIGMICHSQHTVHGDMDRDYMGHLSYGLRYTDRSMFIWYNYSII